MCQACQDRLQRVTFTAEHADREVAFATAWDRFVASGLGGEPESRCESYNGRTRTWCVEFTAHRSIT